MRNLGTKNFEFLPLPLSTNFKTFFAAIFAPKVFFSSETFHRVFLPPSVTNQIPTKHLSQNGLTKRRERKRDDLKQRLKGFLFY